MSTRCWLYCAALLVATTGFCADRPNILWVTCEDISPFLGSYGCKEAQTPNLDKLASEGVRYTHAYANAPVCAVARSTLLNGMFATTTGTHHMRSVVQLPDVIPNYPAVFREAGYYCTNRGKQDYNSNLINNPEVWNDYSGKSSYKNRAPRQSFFSVINFNITHESQLWDRRVKQWIKANLIPESPRIDPADIILPPYHPDLPEIRQDWARLHDLITRMDEQVGEILDRLEKDGLADDTIVFFYSDHGGMLSRSKRYIFNEGTQVPLLIRFPKKWQHLAPSKPGTTCDRLVSFVDFPKTALSLAGITPPGLMQGSIFLGPDTEPEPSYVHFYRDSMSEFFDFSRAVTDGRYTLVRNFMPHRPRGRDTRYGPTVQANWRALENHYDAGKCNAVQSQFFQTKPVLELYDLQNDPYKNLADDPSQTARVKAMDKALCRWMVQTRDIGFIPEPLLYDLAGPGKKHKTLYEYAQSDEYPLERLLEITKKSAAGKKKYLSDYIRLMKDPNPIARYWGAYGAFRVRPMEGRKETNAALKKMIANEPFGGNRVMAAEALALCGDPDIAFETIYKEAEETSLPYVFTQALGAFRQSHTDERLTKDDWKKFQEKGWKGKAEAKERGTDVYGYLHALAIAKDALAIYPKFRIVD